MARKAVQALQSQMLAGSSESKQPSAQDGHEQGLVEDAHSIDKCPVKACPTNTTEAPANYQVGDKRGADDHPQGQPPARRPKEDQAQQPRLHYVDTGPIKEAFTNHELPPKGQAVWSFCTFGQLDRTSKTPWLIGQLAQQSSHGHALSVKFNAHPSGPSLWLRLHMEMVPTRLPFKRQHWHDYADYQWTLEEHTR